MTTAKKTTAAKDDATEQFETAVNAGRDAVDAVVKASTDAAAKGYEQYVAMTKEQVEKASAFAFTGYDEVAEFNKETLDAVIASGNVVAKGVEDLGRAVSSFTQTSLEDNLAVAKRVLGAKSLPEVMQLQSDWAKASLSGMFAESARLQELSFRVTNDAFGPIGARATAAFEKFAKPAV